MVEPAWVPCSQAVGYHLTKFTTVLVSCIHPYIQEASPKQ